MSTFSDDEFLAYYRKTLIRQRILEETSAWLLRLTATERFLHLLGRSLTLSCGASHAAVLVLDNSEKFFRVMMSAGLSRIPPSLVCVKHDSPLIDDIKKNPKEQSHSAIGQMELERLHAKLCFPILGRDAHRVVGLLLVGPPRDGSEYERETISFFHTLSNDIAVEVEKEAYYTSSITDPLTGIYNRKHMDDVFEEVLESGPKRRRIALALLDIDFFKKINDTYGHQAGDQVLKIVSEKIQRSIRKTDFCFRYGGEEFCILFQDLRRRDGTKVDCTSAEFFNAMIDLLKRVKDNIDSSVIQCGEHKIHVTVSMGLTFLDVTEGAFEPKNLIEKADRLLYAAKHGGRNRLITSPFRTKK